MKKNIIYREESPNLKKVMEDFCKAKLAIYQYNPEEYEQKVKNFYENVQSIQFLQTTLLSAAIGQGGGFARKKGNIVIRAKESDVKGCNRLYSHTMQTLIHELNHAWNYEKTKRLGIISKPLTKSRIMKYMYIMEAINEAEAQLLCSKDLKSGEFFNPHRDSKYIPDEKEFLGYEIEESSIFQMLCTVCNQTGFDFLRSIEGMTIEGIISHISTRTGCSIEDSTKYFEKFAELSLNARKEKGKITSKIAKAELKRSIKYARMSEKEKESFIENIDTEDTMNQTLSSIQVPSEYQEIYDMTVSFIKNSSYSNKEKEEVTLKIESIQDVINTRFAEFINTEAHISEQPNQILERYPNLIAVHHNEYDRENLNARFKFGRLDLPELFEYSRYDHTWDEREENAIQKSLKSQTLFSKITLSLLSKIRGTIKKDVTKEKGDEPKAK